MRVHNKSRTYLCRFESLTALEATKSHGFSNLLSLLSWYDQNRMNGVPSKSRIHSWRFASQVCGPLHYSRPSGRVIKSIEVHKDRIYSFAIESFRVVNNAYKHISPNSQNKKQLSQKNYLIKMETFGV